MHTPAVRSPISLPNNTEKQVTSTYKEYGEDFTTVCTQCNRVLMPSLGSTGISIRVSKDEDGKWVDCDEIPDSRRKSLSHGLCRRCFTNLHDDLISSAPLTTNPRTSVLSKSLSSPQFSRHLPSKSKRILVIDDNEFQRRIHKRMVEQAGYECDAVPDGIRALELIEKHSYSFILMDLVMSPLDGWTTSKKIRTSLLQSLGFSSPFPKIIAVTGMQVDDGLSKKCKDAGMNEVIQKPINIATLNTVIQKHSGPQQQPAMKLDR